jgi:methyltransferase (TIGR00027 family)
MRISEASKTAIITLMSRAIESEFPNPIIHDPMARYCLERLYSLITEEERAELSRIRLPPGLTNHIAIRARKYDSIANEYISKKPSCTVVELGCGFSTRYWRINRGKCRYVELDLPEVAALKREVLGDKLEYGLVGRSVLDPSWMDEVASSGNRDFLFLAEGLFMYLPKEGVVSLFGELSRRFLDSRIALEVVADYYTSGIWKRMVDFKFKREIGLSGSSYSFGVKNALELETYGSGIKVLDEWFYTEDPDVRPKILKWLGKLGFSRSQWTVTASINAGK